MSRNLTPSADKMREGLAYTPHRRSDSRKAYTGSLSPVKSRTRDQENSFTKSPGQQNEYSTMQ